MTGGGNCRRSVISCSVSICERGTTLHTMLFSGVTSVQESMLRKYSTFRVPHYFTIQKDGKFNRRQHG